MAKCFIVVLGLAAALLSGHSFAETAGDAERGRAFATAHCARCHAIASEGESPLAVAPPFRTFQSLFVLEWLERALAEGVGRGHREGRFMPETVLSRPAIDDLVAYLRTLPQ
jgi:mono/diheme cytochrome c family protein